MCLRVSVRVSLCASACLSARACVSRCVPVLMRVRVCEFLCVCVDRSDVAFLRQPFGGRCSDAVRKLISSPPLMPVLTTDVAGPRCLSFARRGPLPIPAPSPLPFLSSLPFSLRTSCLIPRPSSPPFSVACGCRTCPLFLGTRHSRSHPLPPILAVQIWHAYMHSGMPVRGAFLLGLKAKIMQVPRV